MGIDMLGTALDFKTFKSLKAKTMFQSNTLLMLAKYMVQGRNYNRVEQEGELGSSQEGICSQKDRTVQKCDAAKPHERSKTTAGKKRSTGSAEHPNDEDDLNDSGKDGDISGKRSKKRVKESGLKFACPFFKHEPERYKTIRSCMGPGWTNVHRVKEHIFRSHCEPPFKCFRCHSAFKTEDELSDHQRQTIPCKVCVPESQDRHGLSTINADTEKRLRSRKTNKSLTEEEKWFNMYQLIFPGHSPPLSPYHSETEDLVALFNRSIGPRFRLDLRERLKREFLDSFPISTMLDDILHQAMAALTNAFLHESDIDGKESETSIDSLQVESFFDESCERTAVAKCADAVSFNPKLPHELKSLPQSVNDTVLNHSTAADSGYTGWLSTTSKPPSDSSSGTKALSSPLGSGEDIDPEKASASIPHLDSEDQRKVGTHGLRQTILGEPLLPPSPDASQSTVHERPGGYSYINNCHHDAGDSSHEYRETCQVANQGNDSRHPFTSPSDIEIWNPFEQELAYPYEPLGSISFNVHLAD
ncbi:uncharacterized protein FFB20_12598 [Fusarium fujikuroi]|nr:uncharacterized protein FFB20_12598 [Fusarium fujikuroi]